MRIQPEYRLAHYHRFGGSGRQQRRARVGLRPSVRRAICAATHHKHGIRQLAGPDLENARLAAFHCWCGAIEWHAN